MKIHLKDRQDKCNSLSEKIVFTNINIMIFYLKYRIGEYEGVQGRN